VQHTDTTRHAHVLLPAHGWGEKSGTVTNSERRISRQRAFLEPAGEARPDWWIVSEVARRLGHGESFDYPSAAAIFREHAMLSGEANGGTRDFDLSGLAGMSDTQYDGLAPVQWPVPVDRPQGTARMFGDGQFFTPSGRARFVPITPRSPAHPTSPDYPVALNTGRVRDHWHTLTRTGLSPRLSGHTVEPYVEVHPLDAAASGLRSGALARIESQWGESVARVRVSDATRKGSAFVPMHWNDRYTSAGCIDRVVSPAVDPVSGEPEFKHTPVRLLSLQPAWYGFLFSRRPLRPVQASYWVSAIGDGYWRYELAGQELPADWTRAARELLCADHERVEWIEYLDAGARRYRAARLSAGRLESCLFVGPDHELPPREWLAGLFALPSLDDGTRAALLTGTPPRGSAPAGRQVCACFGVGEAAIVEAIESGCVTAEAIGARLKAGTNCGSCIPELRALIAANEDEKSKIA